MPLVIPDITSTGGSGDRTTEWQQKLLGKKLGDVSDQVTFAKTELPENHRVLEHDSMYTQDHKPERLNVHLAEDGVVHKVTHG